MQDIVEYKDNFSVERTPINEIKEILGHPYDLREVMRWCQWKWWANLFQNWELFIWENEAIELDLSKHLKDQDLKELYEAMKSISK